MVEMFRHVALPRLNMTQLAHAMLLHLSSRDIRELSAFPQIRLRCFGFAQHDEYTWIFSRSPRHSAPCRSASLLPILFCHPERSEAELKDRRVTPPVGSAEGYTSSVKSAERSFQYGFIWLMRITFFSRRQPFNSFSLVMAA